MFHLAPVLLATGADVSLQISAGCDDERDRDHSGSGQPIAQPETPHQTAPCAEVADPPVSDGRGMPTEQTTGTAPHKALNRNLDGAPAASTATAHPNRVLAQEKSRPSQPDGKSVTGQTHDVITGPSHPNHASTIFRCTSIRTDPPCL